MARLLVTIGTDGNTDWVKTPDGFRYNLGPVSVLRFVSNLVNGRAARKVLEGFLSNGEAMTNVDEERMWTLLAPHRARWSSEDVSPSMSSEEWAHATSSPRNSTMNTFHDDLIAIERHIQALTEAASKKASNLADGVQHLTKLAGKIKSPNQSTNSTYYNLGTAKVHEVGDKVAGLSFDVMVENQEIANGILAKAASTVEKIEKLAAAGRKFNASQAKADLKEATTKASGILTTDLTQSWVKADLTKLAARVDQIHGLFANAKV
jgi:hypothetical protein